MREIDHIVYCVPDLDKAIDNFHDKTGTKPVIGGRHLKKGTRNALVNLENKCYLEFLAIDKKSSIIAPRWMGIDLINEPTITRWSLKSTDLKAEQAILRTYNPELGQIEEGQRMTTEGKLLKWQMSLPLAHPKVELVPFITDWSQSEMHPTDALAEECSLVSLEVQIQQGDEPILNCIKQLVDNIPITKGKTDKITITIRGAGGAVTL